MVSWGEYPTPPHPPGYTCSVPRLVLYLLLVLVLVTIPQRAVHTRMVIWGEYPTPPPWIYLQWTTTGPLFIVSIGISNHTLKGGTYPYGHLRGVPTPTPWIYLQWTTTGPLFIVSISNHTLKGGTYPYGHLRGVPHPTPLDVPAVYHNWSFIYC